MLTAHLLGGFSLSDPKGRDVSPRSRKARGLLGYLLLSDLGSERREKLAGLLWSESPIEQAYDSLRHCVAELRRVGQAAGIAFLNADRQSVRIDRSQIRCDVVDLKANLAAARTADCRHLLSAPDLTLMPGLEADDPTFDNWLLVERERNAEILVREMLVLLQRPGIEPRDRVDLARAIERLDPYQEDAVRIHMEQLAAEGNIAAATAYFERYRARLLREYEVEPSEGLVDFVEGLAARRSGASRKPKTVEPASLEPAIAPQPEAGRHGVPIIAVLSVPSAQQSDQLRYLSEAFMQELVSTLCRFKDWTVTVPGTPMEEKVQSSADAALAELSARGVDFALVASIAAVAGATAINVRLVECDSRAVVISDQYPASSENWLAALNDICCRIASRTKISLVTARLRRVAGRSIERRQAYDLWLEGRVMANIWEPETEEKAVELFSRAVQLDGNLADAYSWWASVLNSRWIVHPGAIADEGNRERAYQLAKRAVALDPLNNLTQGNLGWSHLLARRFESAELHFRLAYELNPSSPDNLLACGLASAFCGDHPRARELSRRAFDLNPFPQPYYYGYRASIDFLGRDFVACIEAVNRVPDLFPDIQGWAAVSHAHLGQLSAASSALDRYQEDMRRCWAGPSNPNGEDLCTWFATAFPIRLEADRQLIADGLAMIRQQVQALARRMSS
ncbi:BTAD domain-containing putative transcriptional regulator [Dongia deserti]|uniref:BTAD domain-containing putative transcriptional regulator n=1 Tax=Dongia deserti TaxID=2268030 RepID=UPI000E64BBF8|nr:BTAD domain-containing putative transcriptional regulator [Dongia deserti]